MASLYSFIGIVIAYLSIISTVVHSEDVCVKKGPCTCEYSNGTGIDITPAAKATFYTTQTFELRMAGAEYALSTYFFHPCYDVTPSVNSTKPGGCDSPLSVSTNFIISIFLR